MNENKPRRRAQAQAAQKKARKSGLSRFVLMVTMMALVAVVSIGGTMAWLQDNTQEVVNTFTTSNIDIDLKETNTNNDNDNDENTNSYQMVPGAEIAKDPKVIVKAGSEACWLFVKLTKVDATYPESIQDVDKAFDEYLSYTIGDGWNALDGHTGVYYRKQDAVAANTADDQLPTYSVLKDDKINVLNTVDKDMMDALQTSGSTPPQLKVMAYAIQSANLANSDGQPITGEEKVIAAAAWALINAN